MMKLDDLLKGTEVVRMHHVPPGLPVGGLHYDSRRIQPGEIFFAIQGEQTDGRLYVPKAMVRFGR
jgi:UDP-N-acetylmuramoyl-L-alanyl-D-glutamate--2,6-diaminopimelate ligase